MGHAAVATSEEREPVENEDLVTFSAAFAAGGTATLTASRVAYGHPNALGFELFAERGAARFDLERASEFGFADASAPVQTKGFRTVLVGPSHPYLTKGLPMDFPGVGYGHNDLFHFQARAFLEQVAGMDRLPRLPTFAEGLHNLRLQEAVVASAAAGGAEVVVEEKGTTP
jgi:predicted dehydrogenase